MALDKEQLDFVVEVMAKAKRYQNGAWQRVQDIGRQYAQAKTFGTYMENGVSHGINFGDKDRYIEMFRDNLLRAVVDAFCEDAQVGIAVNTHLDALTATN